MYNIIFRATRAINFFACREWLYSANPDTIWTEVVRCIVVKEKVSLLKWCPHFIGASSYSWLYREVSFFHACP